LWSRSRVRHGVAKRAVAIHSTRFSVATREIGARDGGLGELRRSENVRHEPAGVPRDWPAVLTQVDAAGVAVDDSPSHLQVATLETRQRVIFLIV